LKVSKEKLENPKDRVSEESHGCQTRVRKAGFSSGNN
jgi:hypothetical protein